MLVNRYISDTLKQKLEEAIRVENKQKYSDPNVCHKYQCTMVFQPKKVQPLSSPKKHYFIRTFDNHLAENGKGNEYKNQTINETHRTSRNHSTEKRALHNLSTKLDVQHPNKNLENPEIISRVAIDDKSEKDDYKENENNAEEVFGPDPRFPPFPTFPSFPNFPEFPASRRH